MWGGRRGGGGIVTGHGVVQAPNLLAHDSTSTEWKVVFDLYCNFLSVFFSFFKLYVQFELIKEHFVIHRSGERTNHSYLCCCIYVIVYMLLYICCCCLYSALLFEVKSNTISIVSCLPSPHKFLPFSFPKFTGQSQMPEDDVVGQKLDRKLAKKQTISVCDMKGDASYLDLKVGHTYVNFLQRWLKLLFYCGIIYP